MQRATCDSTSTWWPGITGELHIVIGRNGHWVDGKYTFDDGDWKESHHPWPADADQVIAKILSAATHSDTYVCVNLMWGDKRHRSSAVRLLSVHADIDHSHLELDKVRAVGGYASVLAHPVTDTSTSTWPTRSLCRNIVRCAAR